MDEPESTHGWHGSDSIYDDNGCEVSPKCTECPLPVCKHDSPLEYMKWRRQQKDLELLRWWAERPHLKEAEVAKEWGLTERTVFRIKSRNQDYLSGQRDASRPGSTAGSARSGTKTP